jgi:hypothetical protein
MTVFYIGNVYSWLLCVYTEPGRTGICRKQQDTSYKVGYEDGLGMSGPCPSGHSSEVCRGSDDATRGSNNNGGSPALEQNAPN